MRALPLFVSCWLSSAGAATLLLPVYEGQGGSLSSWLGLPFNGKKKVANDVREEESSTLNSDWTFPLSRTATVSKRERRDLK